MIEKIKKIIIKLLEKDGISPGQGYQLKTDNIRMNNRPSKIISKEDLMIK